MKRTLIASFIAANFAAPAFAADEPVIVLQNRHFAAAEGARDHADAWKRWAEDFSHEMRASMGTMFAPRMGSAKVVKGAPYSAEMITETRQSLADGNTISRKKSGLIHRDGEGRTRQETGADGKAATIFIDDPVDGKHLILTPGSKRAVSVPRVAVFTHVHRDSQLFRVGATEVRVEDGKVFIDGKEAAPGKVELTSKSGKKVVVEDGRVTIDGKTIVEGGRLTHEGNELGRHFPSNVVVKKIDGPDGTHREEVRVHVVRSGNDNLTPLPPMPPMPPGAVGVPMAPMPPMPGVHTMRFESTAKLGKGVTTQLGMKDFDAVKAEGKSTVWTIPAGEIGNRNPINITSETWYSPDLQVTVHSRYNDPRTGETVYRLANIRRGEPSAELFKVPEDYKFRSRGKS